MGSEDYPKVAEYFVVAGLTEGAQPLEEDMAFPNANHKLSDQRKDPITDICVIDRTLEENCPQDYTCIEHTPGGIYANLNHGSLTAHDMFLCFRRGKDKPPLVDLGVYYEGLEAVRPGISILETTPAGRSANVNNKSGMGSHSIYLTYRRAKESAPQNALVVTDICIILTNKGERAPYAFCQIEKSLNKGLIGSSVHLCYKKSMRQVDSIPYKAGLIGRFPREDAGSFPLPATVPLFCLPMGATIECWTSKTKHPLPTFSSFVLTTETSDKVFGAVVSFYESYPEEKLSDNERYKLGLLRGDGVRSRTTKTIHTNKAICLLSRWPMFSAFRDFLMYLYKMTVSPNAHVVPVERHIAHFIYNVPFPTSQRPRVQYQMSPFHMTILTRPQITPIPLSGASFLALLDDLGPENMMGLIVLALTEHKIVIHSLRPAEITCVAEALITILFPFKWQCTYVPLCPLEMGYVMEAPCPFIVGVDSRYFDLYEPPPDVACINLDTNSITIMEEKKNVSWKVLPRKPAKILRSTLQRYFKEVKECPREETASGTVLDPDMTRTERHRFLELAIQEAVLKFMAALMKGYRQYLRPITEAVSVGMTDPSSLFNLQGFVRSREKSSQRFYNTLVGTQLFSSFIEERSLTSFIRGGEGAAGRSSSLVFFDECIDRLTPDYESVRLIEADESLKSEHTVIIMAPDESGLPEGVGYQYTTFPELQDELFMVDEPEVDMESKVGRGRRSSDMFSFVRRSKQEVRTMQKVAKMHCGDPQLWARLLLSHTYGAWFACLPAFVAECRHKAAALRTAHDALHSLKNKRCFPLPDETYYRMLMHLCSVYNKPALAVRVYQFVRKTGTQLSAMTYGLYNKAMIEGTWPSSNRDGYMLWQKLRNVFLATRHFRFGLRRRSVTTNSDISSEFDATSHTSDESNHSPTVQSTIEKDGSANPSKRLIPVSVDADVQKTSPTSKLEDRKNGQSDHGYNSMPKDEIRRGSPQKGLKPSEVGGGPSASWQHVTGSYMRNYSGSTETTDSAVSSDPNSTPKSTNLERSASGRSVQPPSTLNIPSLNSEVGNGQNFPDLGLKSDDTLVNGEVEETFAEMIENTEEVVSPLPPSPVALEDNVFSEKKGPESTELSKESAKDDSTGSKNTLSNETDTVSPKCSHSKSPSRSPATPEIANHFGGDAKFLSSFSDSDQKRYQELCTCRPSSLDQENMDHFRATRHGSLMLSSNLARGRSSSALYSGGGISPLLGQQPFTTGSHPNTPAARGNFDNITAEDIMSGGSPSHTSAPGRSFSGSIILGKARSPSRRIGKSDSPLHRRSMSKLAGSNNLVVKDGIPMLTSTPLRPVIEPSSDEADTDDKEARDNNNKHLPQNPTTIDGTSEKRQAVDDQRSEKSSKNSQAVKQGVVREDISHLASDPLSIATPDDPLSASSLLSSPDLSEKSNTFKPNLSPRNVSRHLVEEIEDYLQKDSLVHCSSDAAYLLEQNRRLGKSNDNIAKDTTDTKLQRRPSLPSKSPTTPRRPKPSLQRSMTCQEDIVTPGSNSWFGSGSKINSLWKATTVGMANKAKKVASNLAKDLNETMQASIAYYTPERIKGSLSDLTFASSQEDLANKPATDPALKQALSNHANDHYSSQTSLRSSESTRSQQERKNGVTSRGVPRRAGGKKKSGKGRPLSVPSVDSNSTADKNPASSLANSYLSIPSVGVDSTEPSNITASMTSLNSKGVCDIQVVISSCSSCHKCRSLVYDEEIMAGWIGDESNLNTHCPFCHSLFVPFLNIEITDYRACERLTTASQFKSTFPSSTALNTNTKATSPKTEAFAGTFAVDTSSPDKTNTSAGTAPDNSTEGASPGKAISPSETKGVPVADLSVEKNKNEDVLTTSSTSETQDVISDSASLAASECQSENNSNPAFVAPRVLEPVTVPYLSSLVLRKELESMLENEGTNVLTEPGFVDHHPIIYWNLVWYFRRLHLHSNLYDLLLRSQLVQCGSDLPAPTADQSKASKSNVVFHLMWDNMKLHDSLGKPPLYCLWHQVTTQQGGSDDYAYSSSFLENIRDSIVHDDVRGPLVAVLNELNVQQGVRRSAYREILYVILVALGKDSIDIDAFDREYKRAYDALTPAERALAKKCDQPPSYHAIDCRNMFGALDLCK